MSECNYKLQESINRHFPDAVNWRRDLHRIPQPSWLEFYATGLVAEKLTEWGYDILLGKDVIAEERHLLPPDPEMAETEYLRAIKAGVQEQFIVPAKGGFTGVVGVLKGDHPGPTVGFRFDIDSNEVMESSDSAHRPAREGFASQIPGWMHACGHDAHTAIGLLLAHYFAENRSKIKGTIKFLFQPNEENLSGAAAMVAKGHADDLDYLFGAHVGLSQKELGLIALNVNNYTATSRFEVTYTGRPSHAGLRPDEGLNALLGASVAITNLYAIARHGLGASRVNVGIIQAGTTWNIIPDKAYFRMETRGVTDEINQYMIKKAYEVVEGAAIMYGLSVEIKPAASSLTAENSPELIEIGTRVASSLPFITKIAPEGPFLAAEDVTLMIGQVQNRGGKALHVLLGTPTYGGHHNGSFDIDEAVIKYGAEFFAALYDEILK